MTSIRLQHTTDDLNRFDRLVVILVLLSPKSPPSSFFFFFFNCTSRDTNVYSGTPGPKAPGTFNSKRN